MTAFIIWTVKTLDDLGSFKQEFKSIDCVQYYELADELNVKTAKEENLMKQNEIMNKENKLSHGNQHHVMNLIYECMTLFWIYMLIILYTSQSNPGLT